MPLKFVAARPGECWGFCSMCRAPRSSAAAIPATADGATTVLLCVDCVPAWLNLAGVLEQTRRLVMYIPHEAIKMLSSREVARLRAHAACHHCGCAATAHVGGRCFLQPTRWLNSYVNAFEAPDPSC